MSKTRDRIAALVEACEQKGDGAEVRDLEYATYYELKVVANPDLWITFSLTIHRNWKGRERLGKITEHYACTDAGYADDEMSHRGGMSLAHVERTVEGMLDVELPDARA